MGLVNVAGGIEGLHLHLSCAVFFSTLHFTICVLRSRLGMRLDIVAGEIDGLHLHVVYCGILINH